MLDWLRYDVRHALRGLPRDRAFAARPPRRVGQSDGGAPLRIAADHGAGKILRSSRWTGQYETTGSRTMYSAR